MSEKQSYRDSDDMPTERAVLEREWKAMRLALSMPRTPSSPATEPDERSAKDYAIEHAEYMAQSAEHLIAAVNDLALAEEQHDEGTANPSDVDAARETLTEMLSDTRNSIYEFRKRRDRALAAPTAPAQAEPVAWLMTNKETGDQVVTMRPADFGQSMWSRQPLSATPPSAAAQPEAVWRCFHCEEVFNDPDAARGHFGKSEYQQPGCQIDLAEYRRMEEVNRRHCEEDTDLHRAVYAAQGEGDEKARRAEEAGYARGLADAKKHPEELGLLAAAPTTEATHPSSPSDSERLDWLEQIGTANIQRMRRMDPKAPKYWDIEFGNDEDTASGPTLREAIDAAIRATKGGEL